MEERDNEGLHSTVNVACLRKASSQMTFALRGAAGGLGSGLTGSGRGSSGTGGTSWEESRSLPLPLLVVVTVVVVVDADQRLCIIPPTLFIVDRRERS